MRDRPSDFFSGRRSPTSASTPAPDASAGPSPDDDAPEVTPCYTRLRGVRSVAQAFEASGVTVAGEPGHYLPYVPYHALGVLPCGDENALKYRIEPSGSVLTIEGENLKVIRDSILEGKLQRVRPGAADSGCRVDRITFDDLGEP